MTVVIAHRGASRTERENTLAAFRAARVEGADMVELDVHLLADGGVAVHHDAHLPDGRALAGLTAADLPSHVPLLADALAACEGMDVNVEIKTSRGEPGHDPATPVAEAVADIVRAAGLVGRVLVSSFDLGTADRARAAGLATAWLVTVPPPGCLDTLVAHGHGALHPVDRAVTPSLVAECHERGVQVNVWTVDDPERMRTLAGYGVDGICTNLPALAVATLRGSAG